MKSLVRFLFVLAFALMPVVHHAEAVTIAEGEPFQMAVGQLFYLMPGDSYLINKSGYVEELQEDNVIVLRAIKEGPVEVIVRSKEGQLIRFKITIVPCEFYYPDNAVPMDGNRMMSTEESLPRDEEANFVDFEKRILELVNAARARKGLRPLVLATDLMQCADVRAEEISRVYSHTRPDGRGCFTVLGRNRNYYLGENIAAGYNTADAVFEGWMNSTGHRENILNPHFRMLGVGHYRIVDDPQRYINYWVQLFKG